MKDNFIDFPFLYTDLIKIKIVIGDNMTTKEFNVVGMHCKSCVAAVELSLTDLDGVKTAKADLDTNKVLIELDNDVSDEDLIEAINDVVLK